MSAATGAALLATLLSLAVAATSLVLAVRRVGDRVASLTHAAMGVGMAGMFAPWGDPVPAWLGTATFTVLGAWFAASALRGARGAAVHLAISAAAMVLMYLTHHGAPAGATAAGGHAGHHSGGGAAGTAVLPVALLLAGYFAWHAWTCVDRARTSRPTPPGPTPPGATPQDAVVDAADAAGATAVRSRVGVEPLAHATMSVLMAAMFLGVV